MKPEYFITLRYLFSGRKFNFITIINYLSIFGITVGVSALFIIISIFKGLQEANQSVIIGANPHIRISSKDNSLIKLDNKFNQRLKQIENVQSFAYINWENCLINKDGKFTPVTIYSSNNFNNPYFQNINKSIVYGENINKLGSSFALCGVLLADKFSITKANGKIDVFATSLIDNFFSGNLNIPHNEVNIQTIFQTNSKEFDENFIVCTNDIFSSIAPRSESEFNYIDIKINDLSKLDEVVASLNNIISKDLDSKTWKDLNKDYYKVVVMERTFVFLIISLVILIAAFNIFASLSMTIMEKKLDFGVLVSMGLPFKSLKTIINFQGLLIGLFSTGVGLLIGGIFYLLQKNYKIIKLDDSKFIIDALPVNIEPLEIITIFVFTFSCCLLASGLASRNMKSLNFTDYLRSE